MARLSIEEAAAELQRLARERVSLESAYGDLKAKFAAAAEAARKGEIERPAPELEAILRQLSAHVELERDHVATLWKLLGGAYELAAEA